MNEEELIKEFDFEMSEAIKVEGEKPSAFLLDEKFLEPVKETISEENAIILSATLIKQFLHKGTERDYCGKKIKGVYIDKTYKIPPTESMEKGLYFESGCLGLTANGGAVLDLPRNKKNGNKSVDQDRIDKQIMVFKSMCKDHGIKIQSNDMSADAPKNVQVTIYKEEVINGRKVLLKGVVDILSFVKIMIRQDDWREYPFAIIDLKLTKDRNSNFGDFCWGQPENMDHIQACQYHYILGYPFLYLVFDYNKEETMGYKFIPVNFDDMKMQEYKESLRKVVALYEINESYEWQKTNPQFKLCKDCPIKECKDRNLTQEI